MKFIIFVLMAVVLILLIICYSLLVMASVSEEEAEEMYRRWKEAKVNERQEQMIFNEGYRRGKADRHKMLKDGTLVVSVNDAIAVTRVLVEDSKKNGDLYYADRPKGEWIKSKTHASMWVCSNCDWGYQDCYDFDFCPQCGADMRGEDNETD